MHENTFIKAVYNADLNIMKWLLKHVCPMHENTFIKAVYNADLNIMKWLLKNGCPWGTSTFLTFLTAATEGNLTNMPTAAA